MTDNQKLLIQCVVNNNLPMAREYAAALMASSKTAKDQQFCENMLARMKQQENEALQIPNNLQHIIQTNCTAYKFDPARYYLSGREAEVLAHIRKMYAVGERLAQKSVHYTNAVLLHGKSGTGKTTFAQYIASQMNLPFLYVNLTQAIDSYLGKTAQNMELVFNFVFSMPCVVCIDEIDAIGTKRREDSGTSGEMKRVLIGVMQNLDRLPNNVILAAATNRIEAIDDALLRRFTVKHEVTPLKMSESIEMIKQYLSALGMTPLGNFDTFLSVTVSEKQTGLPFSAEGTYNQSTLVDCLNERMAEVMLNTEGELTRLPLYDGATEEPAGLSRQPSGIIDPHDTWFSSPSEIHTPQTGIPEEYKWQGNGRKISPVERMLERFSVAQYECPCCGKANLRIGEFGEWAPEFPEYRVVCDSCGWTCPDQAYRDYGIVMPEFRTWYAAWIYLDRPFDRINDNLVKAFDDMAAARS